VIADGRSDWLAFAREATRLIETEKVDVIFGCWTSASRKSVKPIVEQHNITWTSDKPVRPIPYPSSRTREEWELFLAELFQRWGGNWANSARAELPIAVSGR
jgi:hypothetical protein